MKKIETSSPDDKILFKIQAVLLTQVVEKELELPLRQHHESLSWWAQEALIETKRISLN